MQTNLEAEQPAWAGAPTTEPQATEAAEPKAGPTYKSALAFMTTVLGFGLCRAWIVFCLGAPVVKPAAFPVHWVYPACGALAAIAIAFLCKQTGPRAEKIALVLRRTTPVTLLASGIMISAAAAFGIQALMALGLVIGGVGAGTLQVLWGQEFSKHSVTFAAYASPAAAIVTAVMAAMAVGPVNTVGYVVVPFISFGLLWFHRKVVAGPASALMAPLQLTESAPVPETAAPAEADGATKKRVPLAVGKLMFSILVFSLLTRMFDTLSPNDGLLAFMGGSAVFSLVVVGAVFIVIVHKAGSRFNPTSIYRLSLPIMAAGYVAISLLLDTHAALSVLLINVGYEFFDVLTWVLFVDAARRRDKNPLRIFGLGVACMFAGMALGNTASQALETLVAGGVVQMNMVAMVAVLCLVVVAFLVLPEGTMAQLSNSLREGRKEDEREEARAAAEADQANSASEGSPSEGRIERQCALVAQAYKLTPRESEVIVLLAYGRTLAIIARDLQIAKGTARTHIESIYRKLGVHKQQELIDLVESYS